MITQAEKGHFIDLGLGRGVDGTNPTPWLNKSAFQVRQVFFENIIGTEEGDLFQGFVNEVESTRHLQTNLSASVPVSQLVSLGIDSELSRSYSVNQKSVGRKMITRTISFRADFDDIVSSEKKVGTDAAEEDDDEEKRHPTFEQRLTDWILQQIKEEEEIRAFQEKENEQSEGAVRSKRLVSNPSLVSQASREKDVLVSCREKDLLDHCYRFVNTFSITHYVYALELGASHYRVMSEETYRTKISSNTKLGVGQMADIAIGTEARFGSRKFSSKTTKVGHIYKPGGSDDSKEKVDRGQTDEAVVGVKLQPISSLVVKSVTLRRALQDALQRFIRNKQNVKCKYALLTPCT